MNRKLGSVLYVLVAMTFSACMNPSGDSSLVGGGFAPGVNTTQPAVCDNQLSVANTTAQEGSTAVFTITLSQPCTANTIFSYKTADGTLSASSGYTASSGNGTIPAGSLSTTISVPVSPNLVDQTTTGSFNLILSSPFNASLAQSVGIATILTSSEILDFTGGSLPAGIIFSRASTATYLNEAGVIASAASGAARFEYDPITHALRGLLMEPAATNVFVQSQNLTYPSFYKDHSNTATIAGGTQLALDGSASVVAITQDTSNSTHGLAAPATSWTSGTPLSFSIFLKQPSSNGQAVVQLAVFDSSYSSALATNCNFTTNTASGYAYGSNASAYVSQMINYGNGWYRCVVSGIMTDTTLNSEIGLLTSSATSYLGDGVSGIYAWGGQMEAGYTPTSYIPTGGASVNRSADLASISLGAWFTPTAWSAILDFDRPEYETIYATTQPSLMKFALSASPGANFISTVYDYLSQYFETIAYAVSAPEGQSSNAIQTWEPGQKHEVAILKAGNSIQEVMDGGIGIADGLDAVPSLDTLYLGGTENGGNNVYLKKFSLRPAAVSALEAANLTIR